MRICKYPEGLLNKTHICSNCGCKLKLSHRDLGIISATNNGDVFIDCPVCKNSVLLLSEGCFIDNVYENIIEIIKEKAKDIKHLDEGEVKDSLKEFADDLYNKILDGRNKIDGKGI